MMDGKHGTVYLFGIIPIIRGLYAPERYQREVWRYNMRPYIRWACTIKWR